MVKLIQELKNDFREFSDSCMEMVLFGSHAKGEGTERSDVDACIVKPDELVFGRILGKLGNKYDIKSLKGSPFYIRVEIVKNHVRIYAKE